MIEPTYFDRDISWLGFNRRVLQEAADESLPVAERIKFLSIFSSNLDEFYSVRVPVITALQKLTKEDHVAEINSLVGAHMKLFGSILQGAILPLMRSMGVNLLYDEPIPAGLKKELSGYFYGRVSGFLQPVLLSELTKPFLIENNKLYLLVVLSRAAQKEELAILHVPTDFLPRFYFVDEVVSNQRTIVFLEDVIKANCSRIFSGYNILGAYCIKITRNADLDLLGEFKGNIARKLEKKLKMRAFGPPTRLLYEPGIPLQLLQGFVQQFSLLHANLVAGGHYHNLKDLTSLPLPRNPFFLEEGWPPKDHAQLAPDRSIFDILDEQDLLVHTPYQSFQPILRCFNEAALDKSVKEIFVTVYRVARNSQIINALISAAKNGKKVIVFVELKARFDEANNLLWAKKMKEAGIRIVYSAPELKVHSKIALLKRKSAGKLKLYALLSTGNLNEITAGLYTDHVLLTTRTALSKELESLFRYLRRQQQTKHKPPGFKHLLVSPFNLQTTFLQLIDQEIDAASKGLDAQITIKLNNLEERTLIQKLYDASRAGVKIRLIIRGICCLVPGIAGMSENISITRIVDRFLEHGRVFIFSNQGRPLVFIGSSDWMNRNIHHRIEVCFPMHDGQMKDEMIQIIRLQLSDNVKAVKLGQSQQNTRIHRTQGETALRSQKAIYDLF